MKKNFTGLDVLRGIGIFALLVMHTAFYHFEGLFELDLSNPPAIVTFIGLILMFAGVFAMISGLVHTHQHFRKISEQKVPFDQAVKYNMISGALILIVAYLYFIITGPGLADMSAKFMSNSILVELFTSGKLIGTTVERVLYVDSLVMIGMNILLMGVFFRLHHRFFKKITPSFYLISALLFFAFSLIRIPLYTIYLDALDSGNWLITLLLNWLVNKNNPVFPYLSFALFGAWISALILTVDFKKVVRQVLPLGILLFVGGVVLYITLPDTMLQRSIDPVWFALMMAQNGLFMLFVLAVLKFYDFGKPRFPGFISRFFIRFGVAGLTIFFIESVVSAAIASTMRIFIPSLAFDIPGSLTFGLILALLWGVALIVWEKSGYKFGIEYFYTRVLKKVGDSAKADKLTENQR
ncbi:MAG: hypothetical protein CVU85_08185 [Firmicutes bacterium HGW-Firmicutes-10]|jgi:hypothetical protein|nr:MAG: hypothetical protein CVU85_08185 [Firmicutes bacterium HGW-Firmicutes-10]